MSIATTALSHLRTHASRAAASLSHFHKHVRKHLSRPLIQPPINMSAKLIKATKSRKYYISNKGFTGTLKNATRFSCFDAAEEQLEDMNKLGKKGYEIVAAPEAKNAKGAKAKKNPLLARDKKNPGIIQNPDGISYGLRYTRRSGRLSMSNRFFATRQEAADHGNRFLPIHRHQRFEVVAGRNPVNSWVNWKTNKTNPAMGKAVAAR